MATLNDLTDVDAPAPGPGQVLAWNDTTMMWEPVDIQSCAIYELGGASGVLTVGQGSDVPNPVANGYWLTSDEIYGVVTTPSAAGDVTVDVVHQPAGTVVSTLTFPAGSQVATATPYATVVLSDGEWFETIVTATDGAAAELTVAGTLCTTANGALPVITTGSVGLTEVGEGSSLPADDSQGELFRLVGSANPGLPDGLYMWRHDTSTWQQIG